MLKFCQRALRSGQSIRSHLKHQLNSDRQTLYTLSFLSVEWVWKRAAAEEQVIHRSLCPDVAILNTSGCVQIWVWIIKYIIKCLSWNITNNIKVQYLPVSKDAFMDLMTSAAEMFQMASTQINSKMNLECTWKRRVNTQRLPTLIFTFSQVSPHKWLQRKLSKKISQVSRGTCQGTQAI